MDADGCPDWYKYFLCGVKGALEVIPKECIPSGILAAVWGNIPPNSGLSSSSALVSAAVLLTVHASQVSITCISLIYLYLCTISFNNTNIANANRDIIHVWQKYKCKGFKHKNCVVLRNKIYNSYQKCKTVLYLLENCVGFR